eukprot:COSAG05_NODE_986_length_6286_cov_3.404881_2_plen_70_part_00
MYACMHVGEAMSEILSEILRGQRKLLEGQRKLVKRLDALERREQLLVGGTASQIDDPDHIVASSQYESS